ncbi:hypothetical protein Hdeb2414_s0003g00093391 [Helianthus debilis subsp. tardiflorus]
MVAMVPNLCLIDVMAVMSSDILLKINGDGFTRMLDGWFTPATLLATIFFGNSEPHKPRFRLVVGSLRLFWRGVDLRCYMFY